MIVKRAHWILLFIIALGSCKAKEETIDYSGFTPIVKKGKFQIYIPDYMSADKKISKKALASFADTANTTFLMIIREEIPDTERDSVDIALRNYSTFSRMAITDGLENARITGEDSILINDAPALISFIEGKYAGNKIYYVHAAIETETYFYQVIGWTLASVKSTRGKDLYNAALSFTELN